MKTLSLKIRTYIAKYKIFRPNLKTYLKKTGYLTGSITVIKIIILGGLKTIYQQLLSYEEHSIKYEVHSTEHEDHSIEYEDHSIEKKPNIDFYQYVIVAPNFVSNSAGIYCLYKLCQDLRKKGFPTAIYGSRHTPNTLDAPLISELHMKQLQEQHNNDMWVIYPETVMGNPLNFKNVARWVLNRPGILGGDEVYHLDEKIFVYSDVYMPYVKNTVQGKLCMPTFDSTIFYPPKQKNIGEERGLACYYVGKSTFKEGYFDTAETFEITRFNPAKQELGKLFRSAKVLYSFDNSTALIYEAIACGCPVQIIPDGTQTWDDYKKLEWGTTGIFWDKPVTHLTGDEVNVLLDKIIFREAQYQLELNHFINETAGSPN